VGAEFPPAVLVAMAKRKTPQPRDAKGRFIKAMPEKIVARVGGLWLPLEPKQPSILSRQHYAVVSNDWWGEGRSPAQKE
jgi:hypothetical protein